MEAASIGRRIALGRRLRAAARVGGLDRLVERLASRHQRRARATLADALERAVEDVDRPVRRGSAAVAVDRRAVAEAAPLLLAIAERLRAPGPLSGEAMRLARSLVTDGAGPLYAASAHRSEYPPGTLTRYARATLAFCDHRIPATVPVELVRG